jgi:hypothetical protein
LNARLARVKRGSVALAVCMWMLAGVGAASAAVEHRIESTHDVTLTDGWELQDVAKVPDAGAIVSSEKYKTTGWHRATVPGTVLTSLVNDGIYPDPRYGENERPEVIPDSLARTSYWYRTEVAVPVAYAGRHVWLNFDGINFSADVWVNGTNVGTMRGAFIRGRFDVSAEVKPGHKAVVAVLVTPQPHPGMPHEHTLRAGVGKNGGITAIDGPTFLSTIGWDWLPAVRDRDTGIWQKVYLSSTGDVEIENPQVTTDLPLPRTDSADVAVQTTVENLSDAVQHGVLRGSFGDVAFAREVDIAAHASKVVRFDAASDKQLHVLHPKLWWPNGYGPQNLYTLHLTFVEHDKISDAKDVSFGVRKITYSVPDSENLTLSVNGVRVFVRGGDWGLDEALKRIPPERMEAEFKLHQLANLNMIRNWVGQSTSEEFYDLADKYGMLLWDEFFQPNPGDGPNPDDMTTYMANARDKVLRFRNHPSIAIWCGRNEGPPPPEINAALSKMMAELDPTRLYQPSSTDGRGVRSGGPYHWREPRDFYTIDAAFKTETGSMSVPTIESVHAMMPWKDWESINDDWAEHDFAKGAQQGDQYPAVMAARYGAALNLADFVRKGQMMNYEAFRAMYEGREAAMFHPATAVITWMSNPAHPSFTWQIYDYDLEPMSSLFAVKEAGEVVHVALNQSTSDVFVVNTMADAWSGAVTSTVYAMDGMVLSSRVDNVAAKADAATVVAPLPAANRVSIVRLELRDKTGKLVSENFYWRGAADAPDDLQALDGMAKVTLEATASRRVSDGENVVTVTLRNPAKTVALMAHVQLRRKDGERVLPQYASDNYISLAPGESRTVTITAASADFHGESAVVDVDGWNVAVKPFVSAGVSVETNVEADPAHWPVTGLPFATVGLR